MALGTHLGEKHVSLSRDFPGPDSINSPRPGEFRLMVISINNAKIALGRLFQYDQKRTIQAPTVTSGAHFCSSHIFKKANQSLQNMPVPLGQDLYSTPKILIRWRAVELGTKSQKDYRSSEVLFHETSGCTSNCGDIRTLLG